MCLNKKVVNNTSAISETIKNNKFEIFSTSKPKNSLKLHQKLKGYLQHKMVTSRNVSSEGQVKNLFIL